ncbi:MAG: type I-U CRISPR-associated helicase/endonuclease Cas3, partial [Candidatus Methylumidiphilus sp.]
MTPFQIWYQRLRKRNPYPWQIRLAEDLAAGRWPDSLDLPTGSGKTTLLDIWAWGRSQGWADMPTRLYWCVDRQIVVDAVARSAEDLRGVLPGLRIATLHGGLNIGDMGVDDPTAPAVITTTVDLLGSRLLFRAYGSSRHVAPMHAGLAGNDALLVLDEAHISAPFAATLAAIRRLRRDGLGLPWRVLLLSATPRDGGGFGLDAKDYADKALGQRLQARKDTRLVKCGGDALAETLALQAQALREDGAAVVAVVCNRVSTARRVFALLRPQGDACLLTGRVRRADRERILGDFLPRIDAASRGAAAADEWALEDGQWVLRPAPAGRAPLFVVATQTIEVGADLDFDGMVSELASLPALLQRAGRLNRGGVLPQAPLVIVGGKPGKKPDQVYGEALPAAWDWLAARGGKGKTFDLSPAALRGLALPAAEAPDYPLLGAADVRALAQTSVRRHCDVAPWLRGWQSRPEAALVWRADLPDDPQQWAAYLDALPPTAAETLSLPVWELHGWLAQLGDRPVALWDGEPLPPVAAANLALRAGLTVVAPCHYGGGDAWGWAPDSSAAVADVCESHRIHPALQPQAADWLAAYYDENDPISERALLKLAGLQAKGAWRLRDYPGGVALIVGAPIPEHVAGVAVPLPEHLRRVAAWARAFTHPQLPQDVADALAKAALWHDLGKFDERFQILLGAGGGAAAL